MTDRPGRHIARRTMGERVADSDIDRLLNAARNPTEAEPRRAEVRAPDAFATRLDTHYGGRAQAMTDGINGHTVTIWDVPVFILYACLGVFTRIWTEVALYFDFGEDTGFRMFVLGVSLALHGFIIAIIGNAWRGKWEFRIRNFLAMAALGGYLGTRMITQL